MKKVCRHKRRKKKSVENVDRKNVDGIEENYVDQKMVVNNIKTVF